MSGHLMAAAAIALLFPSETGGAEPAHPVSDRPGIAIRQDGSPHEWPFTVGSGTLECTVVNGGKVVVFSENWLSGDPGDASGPMPRSTIVSASPLVLLAGLDRTLLLPFDSPETLIRRLAPFERMGAGLCDLADAAEDAP